MTDQEVRDLGLAAVTVVGVAATVLLLLPVLLYFYGRWFTFWLGP